MSHSVRLSVSETDEEHDQDDHPSAGTVDGVPGYQGETQLAF